MIRASCLLLLVLVSLGLADEPEGMLDGMPSGAPDRGRPKLDIFAQGLTEDEKAAMLALHNKDRGEVSPSASNMGELQWNDELAKDAQDWADQCIYKHNGYGDRRTSQWRWVGQNIAEGTIGFFSVLTFVDWWNSEKDLYNYADRTCEPGKECGHYTQV
ncbi:peptidase inhibitor 16-like [Strongylocentrotus purpuratus]|uniref:SCP domain-containing protein n=1 Tax=Strongylocentrotus purpuratus TaxID=7668 RepID=A0A7M7NDU8_STRPU|nr:peptidase inhibitor 16-like [Strongylocentrotus purpuratus]